MKKEEFSEEKQEIGNKIYEILNMKDNYFLLNELDHDIDKQGKILALIPDLEKYFKTREISFLHCNKKVVKPYMSIIRCVFKYLQYSIIVQTVNIKREDIDRGFLRTQKYFIFKPNETIII